MPSVSDELSTLIPTKPTKTTESFSTLRRPPYTYIRLSITNNSSIPQSNRSQATPPFLDEITLRSHLTAALNQYLGLTGTAIPIDILKVEHSSHEAWVRFPREDEHAVIAALAQWMGKGNVLVRVTARGTWLGGLTGQRSGLGEDKLWSLEK